jgi:hypothetical protein
MSMCEPRHSVYFGALLRQRIGEVTAYKPAGSSNQNLLTRKFRTINHDVYLTADFFRRSEHKYTILWRLLVVRQDQFFRNPRQISGPDKIS